MPRCALPLAWGPQRSSSGYKPLSGAKSEIARDISERLLALTGQALLANDFESFARHFQLPHFIATLEHERTIETQEELCALFMRVTEDYQRRRVTDLVRFCDVAEFRTPTRIEATHTTHMMSGDQRVIDPFPTFSVLDKIDGDWKVSSSQYAVDTNTTVGHALKSTLDPQSGASKHGRTRLPDNRNKT